MRGRLGDLVRLHHIYDAIVEIEGYLEGVSLSVFNEQSMLRNACVKQLEIIGEASDHISFELKERYSEIEWHRIKGMRNILVHEYFGIDSTLVWQIIQFDLPDFKEKIREILKSMKVDGLEE
jgi:uncharacterized protein with HEPN domain